MTTEDARQDQDEINGGRKYTLERRVDLLERDTRNHARSLTEIVQTVAGHGLDLKKLEEWQMTRLLAQVREEERDTALYGRLDAIDKSIAGMRSVWTRILWIAAGVVIPASIVGVALVLVFGAKLAVQG